MYKNKNMVDIIIPNYNKGKYLDSAIKSVINQSFKNWNLYIIDDHSIDSSKKILKKYKGNKKIKIHYMKKNMGPGYCRNIGILKSKSELIAFLDSDDLWKKNKLKIQLKFMEKNKCLFSYTDYESFILKSQKKTFLGRTKVSDSFNFKQFTRNSSINTSTMIINRKLLFGIKFRNLNKLEDYIFKCEILKRNKNLRALKSPNATAIYRILHDARSSNILKNIYYLWYYNLKFNKLSFLENLLSLIMISINSLKKYGFK